MKKLIEGKQPEAIKAHYPLNYNNSTNNSMQDILIIVFHQTKMGTSSLYYKGFKLWNDFLFAFIQTLQNFNKIILKKLLC